MKAKSNACLIFSTASHDLEQNVALVCTVNQARRPARDAYITNPLARAFINAAQDYQAALRCVAVGAFAASPAMAEYWEARKAVEIASYIDGDTLPLREAEMDLVRTEMVFVMNSHDAQSHMQNMVQTGHDFMRSTPRLAMQLDLPPIEKIWNRVKLAATGLKPGF